MSWFGINLYPTQKEQKEEEHSQEEQEEEHSQDEQEEKEEEHSQEEKEEQEQEEEHSQEEKEQQEEKGEYKYEEQLSVERSIYKCYTCSISTFAYIFMNCSDSKLRSKIFATNFLYNNKSKTYTNTNGWVRNNLSWYYVVNLIDHPKWAQVAVSIHNDDCRFNYRYLTLQDIFVKHN